MEKENNKLGENINNAVDDVKEYIDLRMQLVQLNVSEKVSVALAGLITTGTAVIFFVLCFIFGSFALSYMLGNVLHNTAAGFGVLAGFYLILGLIVLKMGKGSLKMKIINAFIKEFNAD